MKLCIRYSTKLNITGFFFLISTRVKAEVRSTVSNLLYFTLRFYFPYLSLLAQPVNSSPRSIYISRSIYNLHRLNRKAVFFILLIDNFTVIWFVQCPSHIIYIINCHAKHETEDLQMDIHLGLSVLATGN